MPVTTFFTSAATFLYAISSLFGGAQNTAIQGPAIQGPVQVPSVRHEAPPISYEYSYGPSQSQSQSPSSSASAAQFFKYTYNDTAQSQPPLFFQRRNQIDKLDEWKARARGLVTFLTSRSLSQNSERNLNPNDNQHGYSEINHEHHAQQAAEAIFQNLITHTFRHNATNAGPLPDEITYYDKETIATIFMDMNGNVTRCRLIEVVEPEDSERVLQMIGNKNKLIEKATFRTMLTIITACQALEPKRKVNSHSSYNEHTKPLQASSTMNMTAQYNMWSIISGILPGTKWCGLGDISSSYDDLGPEKNLDKCCRAHDHCPIKVKAFRARYGLVNWSLYTKSHCECDSLLYTCLKNAGTPTAEMLGNFYFNVLRIQCVDEDDESVQCTARDPSTGICKLWQSDGRQPKRLTFKTVQREF